MAYESSDRRRVTVDTVIEDTIPEVVEPRKTKKIRPLYDKILVRVKVQKEVVQNGILLPQTAVEKPLEGEVVAIGEGEFIGGALIPFKVQVGDEVLFGRYSGNEVVIDNESLLMLQSRELHGVYYYED